MPHRTSEELRAEIIELERQLTDAKQAIADLEHERDTQPYLQAVLDSVPIGVVLTDRNGKIIQGNRWVEDLARHPVLHSEDAESYGEWISFHDDGRRVESHEYPLARVIQDNEDLAELDVHYQRGDGTRLWMRIIGRPIVNAQRDRVGAAVALIDIDAERRLEQQQQVLIGELDHRVKNAFAVMRAIVRRSLEKVSMEESDRRDLLERLDAYAASHAKLVGNDWETAPLAEIVEDSIGHIEKSRISVSGDPAVVPSRSGLAIAMALYELGTNALKHGALSGPDGTVSLNWVLSEGADSRTLDMEWREENGPVVSEPERGGFGTFVTTQALAAATGGEVEVAYETSGLNWKFRMHLPT